MTRFADLESRVNASVLRHLSNASAQIGASTLSVLVDDDLAGFDDSEPLANAPGATGYRISVLCQTTQLPANPIGAHITITSSLAAGNWAIAYVDPDSAGMSRLTLSKR